MAAVVEEIVTWIQERPRWQQQALHLLLDHDSLTDDELGELAELCVTESRPSSEQQQTDHPALLPNLESLEADVALSGISEVENVNALHPSAELAIPSHGLCVVYGDNGSGKSGFARILKQSCRSRASDPILPNVYDPGGPTPSATVHFVVDGEERSFRLGAEEVLPRELDAISVFDGDCEAVYVDENHEVAYRPRGLHLLDELWEVCAAVKERIQRRSENLEERLPDLSELHGEHAVGQLVEGLSVDTERHDVAQLARLGDADHARIIELEQEIAQFRARSPASQAGELRRKASRLEQVTNVLEGQRNAVDNTAVEQLQSLAGEATAARSAANGLAQSTFAEAFLGGVGGESWRRMWDAARQYSVEDAYPDSEFPEVEAGARCVLCQQELSAEAAERLRAFEAFVRDDLETAAQAAEASHQEAIQRLEAAEAGPPDFESVVAELREGPEGLASQLESTATRLAARHSQVMTGIRTGDWAQLDDLQDDALPQLQGYIATLRSRATELENADAATELSARQAELDELVARRRLGERLADVTAVLDGLAELAVLGAAIRSTDTRALSTKSSELTSRYVTEPLVEQFLRELQELGVQGVEVSLDTSARGGVPRHRIRLIDADRSVKTSEILSEGEQRAMGLAAFLSEISVSPSASGIVADDPVSSLDHRYRGRVARRLVSAAQERQVLIFTHDLVFLLELNRLADESEIDVANRQVRRVGSRTGIQHERNIWPGSSIRDRLAGLNERVQEAEPIQASGDEAAYSEHVAATIGYLREAWERAVEEVVLNQAVMRFKHDIETRRLRVLHLLDVGDYEAIDRGMSWCSTWLPGHDQAAAANAPMPDLQEVRAQVSELRELVSSLRERGFH